MNDEQVKSKALILRERLTLAIQEALSESGDEVLLNKWVFVADLFIDGERRLVPVWDSNIDAVDLESMLGPAHRMSKVITNMHVIGIPSESLDYLGMDDDDEDDDEDG